ncbi:MAG: 3-isopropylmalate/(R)-2-methylmalate dehydratase large subunit [Gammaproteobacteria bacterium]|jgi:3-isopropylmalate/(R)-2-methylmalate dehydratase large subunit
MAHRFVIAGDPNMPGETLFEKIWQRHVVVARDDGQTLLYIDRHLAHDGSFNAFNQLRKQGLTVRRPDQTFATPDHYTPTHTANLDEIVDPKAREITKAIDKNAADFGVHLFAWGDKRQGIVHVVGPEQGITLPGLVMVCGDSHTSTHGALGCLAFGIGASEVAHVLATQTLWQSKPRTMRVTIDGSLGFGVTGKDVILAIIREIGTAGGTGYSIEYAGSAIRDLSMEGRLTLCNMTIEAGSRSGLVAADEKTFAYIKGRPFAPSGEKWDKALAFWRTLSSDDDAVFDREVSLNGDDIAPMVTWGNSPQDALQITESIPDPATETDPDRRNAIEQALDYMGLTAGQAITDINVDKVFIGACTNGRIEDLRAAAAVAKGRKAVVQTLVVPGSGLVKEQAESEGLDHIFIEAGFEWRLPGCSMCIGMNGDTLQPGERSASTSNRNFRGRQGPGSRTHLVGPAMAAAAAVTGHFTDVRELKEHS